MRNSPPPSRLPFFHELETDMPKHHEDTAKPEAGAEQIQSRGRAENAAEPLNAAKDNAGAERYPPAGRDDSVEPRSFAKTADPDIPPSPNEGRLGPASDPAEGKR